MEKLFKTPVTPAKIKPPILEAPPAKPPKLTTSPTNLHYQPQKLLSQVTLI